jgi:hypothetical protein
LGTSKVLPKIVDFALEGYVFLFEFFKHREAVVGFRLSAVGQILKFLDVG